MTNPTPGVISFATYRDPKPFDSCLVFEKCLEEASSIDFSVESVEKSIVGDYSHWLQPQTPRGRGVSGLMRKLSAICDSDRERKLKWLLNTDSAKMKSAFFALSENAKNSVKKRRVVICSKENLKDVEKKHNRKIIYLPI